MSVAFRAFCAAVAVAVLVGASCGGRSPTGPSPNGTVGLDYAFTLARQQPNLTSLVVAQDGNILRQEFFNGGGQDITQDVRSVTKSVTSLLIGIALDRGCLHSVDDSIGQLLGPLGPSDPAKTAVTVRQLLTMTSGIGGNELTNISLYNEWVLAPNQLDFLWNVPMQATPGARFAYYTPAYHVLSPILTKACAQSTSEFARNYLFTTLGIGYRQWETDNQGYFNGGAGLTLTPRDMVAIGNLVLAGGRVGGAQVVPASWIAAAAGRQVATNAQPYATGYGFGWWIGQTGGIDFVFANGWGGQFIVVVPRSRLVVTATNRWQNVGTTVASTQWRATIDIIMQRIVPAF